MIELLRKYIDKLDLSDDGFNTLFKLTDRYIIVFTGIQDGNMLVELSIFDLDEQTVKYKSEILLDPDDFDDMQARLEAFALRLKWLGLEDEMKFKLEENVLLEI